MDPQQLLSRAQKTQNVKLPIFGTAPNAESCLSFLGSWKPILRSMFEFRRKQLNMKVPELLRRIIQGDYDKMDVILDLFGFAPVARYQISEGYEGFKRDQENINNNYAKLKEQILNGQKEPTQAKPASNKDEAPDLRFIRKEKYDDVVTGCVLEICTEFIKEFLGESPCSYADIFSSNSASDNSEFQSNQDDQSENDKPSSQVDLSTLSKPSGRIGKSRTHLAGHSHYLDRSKLKDASSSKQMCILIFDNAHLLEEESWSLILRLQSGARSSNNLCITMVANQDFKGAPIMPKLEK